MHLIVCVLYYNKLFIYLILFHCRLSNAFISSNVLLEKNIADKNNTYYLDIKDLNTIQDHEYKPTINMLT